MESVVFTLAFIFFILVAILIFLIIKYDENRKKLSGLREVNDALTTGLEAALFVIEKWEELRPERLKSITEKLHKLAVRVNKN